MQNILQGDCLEVMRTFPDNHFSCVVTDPPYGLHFMGKDWDGRIPAIEYWQEALRVCKPGSHLLAFGGSRTHHHLMCAIEGAGWEIRDCIMWIYGSGFPKSHNHFGFKGYGTALKPAYEPIIVAMKPLDGTFAQNAEKWGVAGINIDECRIGTDQITTQLRDRSAWHGNRFGNGGYEKPIGESEPRTGRWPANIILDEIAGEMLDQQSGNLKSGQPGIRRKAHHTNSMSGRLNLTGNIENGIGDSGGASRFFYCAKASSAERNAGLEGMPDKIGGGMCSTVSGDTRSGHITIQKNNHPTVKPLKLMEYLIKLVMPPKDGIVLDPFAGSGTTIVAAKRLGFSAVGIEKSEEYAKIARARVDAVEIEQEQLDLFEAYGT